MGFERVNDLAEQPPLELFSRLYAATKPAHHALESSLQLLRKPITAERIGRALERFLGFHLAWEPWFAASELFAPIMKQRGRARFASADLEALGRTPEQIAAVPKCAAAADLHRSAAVAMGSLYVMEGSTLGGEVIAKVLRAEAWVPAGGLQYFSPPGRHTRSDWGELKAWAERHFAPATWGLIEQGAQETFTLMNTWQSTP